MLAGNFEKNTLGPKMYPDPVLMAWLEMFSTLYYSVIAHGHFTFSAQCAL